MATTRGFFSIIQFCPDLDRCEGSNVGVVLAVPQIGYLGVRTSTDNEGPKRRFGKDAFDDGRLALAKRALECRILSDGKDWSRPEDLVLFSKSEGNQLVLLPPRVILVEKAEAELEELFLRLAHVEARHRQRTHKPNLRDVFEPGLIGVPLRRDIIVTVPEFGDMNFPYGYKNGRLNLIQPEAFPVEPREATRHASELAVKGHILFKHPNKQGEQQSLVVVGGFSETASDEIKNKIRFIFQEHDSRLVSECELPAFVDEIRREAHA